MAGYWPRSFFAGLWTLASSISSHLDRTNLVNKGFIIRLSENFSCRIQRVVPSEQDGSILPVQVVNHIVRFGSCCLLAELAIQ